MTAKQWRRVWREYKREHSWPLTTEEMATIKRLVNAEMRRGKGGKR